MPLPAVLKPEVQKLTNPTKAEVEIHLMPQGSIVSRPLSALAAPRPNAPVISRVQTTPLLSRSMSAAGRLGTNCCRFDRSARHANDGIGRMYNVSGGSYDGLSDVGHEVGDGYPFPLPDYSNLPFGVNGYSVFRPARGH